MDNKRLASSRNLPSQRIVAKPFRKLIPGTDEYYYFHCLHFQNERQLAESQAILDAWRAKFGDTQPIRDMVARQRLNVRRESAANPGLPPHRTRAEPQPGSAIARSSCDATQPLDNSQLEIAKLLESAIAADRSLGLLETDALGLVLDRSLAPDQLRALIGRLERADLAGVVKRIAEELALKDSRGFGWASIHAQLTLEQLDELLVLRPSLLEDDAFVRAYTRDWHRPKVARCPTNRNSGSIWGDYSPGAGGCPNRRTVSKRSRSEICCVWTCRNASMIGSSSWNTCPYRGLPRITSLGESVIRGSASYSSTSRWILKFPCRPWETTVHWCVAILEHFLQSEDNVDAFAAYLNRQYLEKVLAETKILYGLGDEAVWYSKLSPADQRELRERIELRFAPHNQSQYVPDDAVSLDVELKNVQQLTVNIFEINTLSFYRNNQDPISTAIRLRWSRPERAAKTGILSTRTASPCRNN